MSYKILLIDDTVGDEKSSRQRNVDLIERDPKIEVVRIHPMNLEDGIKKEKEKGRLDIKLSIVDYKLNSQAGDGDETYPYTGLACVGLLRECFPQAPIFLISAHFDKAHESEVPSLFDKFITDKQLTQLEPNFLLGELNGMDKINNYHLGEKKTALRTLLCVPEASEETFLEALSSAQLSEDEHCEKDKYDFSTTGLHNAIEIYRWIHGSLFATPGILYDAFHTATFLGMTMEYFTDTFLDSADGKKLGEQCVYQGIFKESRHARWWKAEILNVLYDHVKTEGVEYTESQMLASYVYDIPDHGKARCGFCGEVDVETTAYNKTDLLDPLAAHFRCSIPKTITSRGIYFDSLRLFIDQ